MTQTLEPQPGHVTGVGSAPERAKRPRAVTIVGVVTIIFAIFSLILAVLDIAAVVVVLRGMPPSSRVLSEPHVEALVVGTVLLITALAMLVTAAALLRMHRWAWSVSMTLVAIGLAGGLASHFSGQGAYPDMLLYTVLAFALNRAVIQEAFGIQRHIDEQHA